MATTNVYHNTATPSAAPSNDSDTSSYDQLKKEIHSAVTTMLGEVQAEVNERNDEISDRDDYIYGDKLKRSLDIPIGHDFTPVNWLKRTVEIHKTQFMGRPFQMISTYDTQDLSMVDDQADRGRKEIENKKEKAYAEERRNFIDGVIRDNGGHAMFMEGAESASAVGAWVVKAYYDTDEDKYMLCPVEAIENCYAVWSKDDFRQYDAFAYVYQISKSQAISKYDCKETVATSPVGTPLGVISTTTTVQPQSQPMVSIIEVTGKIPGWKSEKGKIKKCVFGKETEMNLLFAGDELKRVIDEPKKLPKYYIFPNKKARRRAWGLSDITDAAININLTYIETLSDWRTVGSKVNFPKFKGFNFGPDTQVPKFQSRRIQMLPLADGQDVVPLQTGDANRIDFAAQLSELKEQFVRETGISRVLFDDPSITLNSNQALITSMKPTSDIAENKKELWSPILVQMFTDAIDTVALHKKEFKDLADSTYNLKVQWPSIMQKEDPVFQQMLLNRWNSGTLSAQTYFEMQGETKEEIDRIRDEFSDPITAAMLGKSLGPLSQFVLGLPSSQTEVSGEQPAVATPANNTPGAGPVSMPGSGATPVSPQGALEQADQQEGG